MSDELGMGLTTQLLAEELSFWAIVDTLYLLRVLAPHSLSLVKSAKHGPAKSPDFIALDDKLRPSVIECKGTQTSHTALLRAMANGREQKANVTSKRLRIRHALVVGLFIPQTSSPELARVHIMDPNWTAVDSALADYAPPQIARSAVQVDLAKHLALIGAVTASRFFGLTPTEELRRVPSEVEEDLSARRSVDVQNRSWFRRIEQEGGAASLEVPTRFQMEVPTPLIERLRATRDLRETLSEVVQSTQKASWVRQQETDAERVQSPLGFVFSLTRQ
jgi:hypothetical protein